MSRCRFTLFAILLASASPLVAAEPTDRELIEAVQRQVTAVIERAEPSIALVVVSRSELYPNLATTESPGKLGDFDRVQFVKTSQIPDRFALSHRLDLSARSSIPDNSTGGGVVIDSAGLVLTPFHVIDGATKIYVYLPGGGSYADIHAADARCDLAVLKLLTPPPNLKAIPLATVRTAPAAVGQVANFQRGKWVVIAANTYDSAAVERVTGAMGLIAGTRERPPESQDTLQPRLNTIYDYGNLIQYVNQFAPGRSSRLNLGGSGAALLNLDGELVGLSTTASPLAGAEDGPGYALPMDEYARRAIDVLKRGEEIEYGFLGVMSSRHRDGVQIRVSTHGPADLAGLQNDDVIRRVNGHRIENHPDLFLHVGSSLAGTKTRITVQRIVGREKTELDYDVVLGKYQHGLPSIAASRPAAVFGLRVDHGSVLLQQLIGNDLGLQVPAGVVVRELVPDSPAAAKFKTLNDAGSRWIITAVNGRGITSPAEFYSASKGLKSITLTVIDPTVSNPKTRELTLP